MEGTDTAALRSAAPDWTLAGDKQLLDLLQNIHQSLMTRCQDVNQRLDEMVTSLDDASVDLQNVNNKFMALSNSQFIESRVYDDDLDVVVQERAKEPPKETEPSSELAGMRESVKILEDMHETIQILDSDSDSDMEDDDITRTILKPKDVYQRPLPHVIGSRAWRAGPRAVRDGDSDSDSDSDADSDSRKPREEYSDSEPDLMDSFQAPDVQETTSSSSLPSDQDLAPAKPSPADVAAELAKRLRGATPPVPKSLVKDAVHRASLNSKYVKKQMPESDPEYAIPKPSKVYRGDQPTSTVFSDEPPPLDQYESEEDDDIFAELHKTSTYTNSNKEQSSLANDLFSAPSESRTDRGVFDDFNDNTPTQKSANQVTTLFSDESEPELFAQKPASKPGTSDNKADLEPVKKPIGGISLFGSNKGTESIGAAILKRNQRKTSSDEETTEESVIVKDTKPTEKDIFEDLFAKTAKSNKPINKIVKEVENPNKVTKRDSEKKIDLFSDDLFDNIDDIFTTKNHKVSSEVKGAKKVDKSIFDDNYDDLFADIAIPKSEEVKVDDKPKNSLFDSDDELFSDKNAKFTTKEAKKESKPIIESHISKPSEKLPKSIFDDDSSDSDIFTKLRETRITNSNEDSNVTSTYVNSKESNTENSATYGSVLPSIQAVKAKNIFSDNNVSKDKVQTLSLFNDDDSEYIFSTVKEAYDNEKINTSKEITNTDNIFATKISKENEHPSTTSLFDENNHDDNDIFATSTSLLTDNTKTLYSNKDLIKNEKVITNNKTSELFDHIGSDAIINDTKEKFNDFKDTYNVDDIPPPFDIHEEDDLEQNEKIADTVKNTIDIADSNIITKEIPPSLDNSMKDTVENVKDPIIDNKSVETDSIPETKSISDSLFINTQEPTSVQSKLNFNVEKIKPKVPDFDVTPSDSNKDNKSNDSLFSSPSVFETDNIFSDILDEPPVFEKSKESKKSKNINALFDDDSDDEASFFKKNDVILDDKPDFNTDSSNDALFGVFHNEPPAIDIDFTQKSSKIVEETPDFIPNLNTTKENETNPKKKYNFTDKFNENDIPKTDVNDLFDIKNTDENIKSKELLIQPNTDNSMSFKPDDLFNSDSDDIFQAPKPKNDIKPELKEKIDQSKLPPKPEVTKSKIADSVKDSDPPDSPKKIGKLKSMSFNINVNTLLPGASPKKKSVEQTDGGVLSTKSQENLHTAVKIEPVMVKSVSFEGEPDSQVLDNKISKERAKIQVKRRPSTRRARREAVRKSTIDIGDDSTDNSSSFDDIPKPRINKTEPKSEINNVENKIDNKHNTEKPTTESMDNKETTKVKEVDIKTDSFIPKQDNFTDNESLNKISESNVKSKVVYILNDEDIFNSKPEPIDPVPKKSLIISNDDDEDLFKNLSNDKPFKTLGDVYKNTIKPETSENAKKSLFDDLSDDENELFNTNQKTVAKPKGILDSDSEEDLFGGKKETKDKVASVKETKHIKAKVEVKGSLFGDDDDDDLFGAKVKTDSVSVGPSQQPKPVRDVSKPAELVFDDPLSLFGEDEE